MHRSKPSPDRARRSRTVARCALAFVFVAFLLVAEAPRARAALLPSEIWNASSGQAGAFFGWIVVSAGDVNGDGFEDILVGAPLAFQGQVDEGRVYLFYGSQDGLQTPAAWTAESNQAGAMFGAAIAGVGDVDGDGYDDVLIGAPMYDGGQVNEGAVFLFTGSDTGLSSSPVWTAEGNQAGAMFGAAIAGPGDVNFDGFDDVLIGAPGWSNGQAFEGQARVYLGSDTGLEPAPVWTAESNHAGAQFGSSVAFGDVNSDFMNDVVIGAPYDSITRPGEGTVSVFLGKSTGVFNNPAYVLAGGRAHEHFGYSVAADGDVDGNGYLDVLVGAPGYARGQRGEGMAALYLASAAGLATSPAWQEEGNQEGAAYGFAVKMMRDIDNDGFEDFAVGAPGFTGPKTRSGRVFIYLGQESADEVPAELAGVLDGNEAGGGFGDAIAAADVNHDASYDLVAGAMYHTGLAPQEGMTKLFLFLGAITATPGVPGAGGLAIEGVSPNPSHGRIRVALVLPSEDPARLELFDVSGRRVTSQDLAGFGVGRHEAEVAQGAVLPAGLYFIRVSQKAASVTARVLVVR